MPLFYVVGFGANKTNEADSVLDDIEEEGAADNSILDFDIKGKSFSLFHRS